MKFVDIAGLVRGASKGEGLGNQFLANIRETDAIAHVVRCFEDDNIVHVEGRVDPVADIATIDTELCLKDLETVDKRIERAKKALKGAGAEGREADRSSCARRIARAWTRASRRARRGLSAEDAGAAARTAAAHAEEGLLRRQRRREAARPPPTATRTSPRCARTPPREDAPVVVICAAAEAEIAGARRGRPARVSRDRWA